MIKFALDYDGTFTADKLLWRNFIERINAHTIHTVTFVTLRFEGGNNDDIIKDAKELGLDIVFCNGRQKSECFNADIWIDDIPEVIPSADVMRNCLASEEMISGKE